MVTENDPDILRLRRFTLGVGAVYFIVICGEASFVANTIKLGFLGDLKLENFSVVTWLVHGVALYACSLFAYRQCYLKKPGFVLRRWLKRFGVIIEFLDSDIERCKARDAERPYIFSTLSDSEEPPEVLNEIYRTIPAPYLKYFMISFIERYSTHHSAMSQEIIDRILGGFFPFISGENLEIPRHTLLLNYGHVKIKNLNYKIWGSIILEDFIYFLPLLPFAIAYLWLIFPFLFHLFKICFS